MKAITTKYLPATDTKPSRIKASDRDGNSVTVSYTQGHTEAVVQLCRKMNWHGSLADAWMDQGTKVWVWLDLSPTRAANPHEHMPTLYQLHPHLQV